MDIGKYTTKSQEVLRKSQEIAVSMGQQQVDVFHFLNALISQEGSIVGVILEKFNVDMDRMRKATLAEIQKYPKGMPAGIGQVFVTPGLIQILEQAEKEMVKIGDEFVSTEHLLLALLSFNSPAKKFLDGFKVG